MSNRLKSEFFVKALIRQAASKGLFAAVLRQGDADAGAIYLSLRARDGRLRCFGPAPQASYGGESLERQFMELPVTLEEDLQAFLARESRFDPDLWLVEIEDDTLEAPVPIARKPESSSGLF